MKFRPIAQTIEALCWTGGPDQTEDLEWMIQAMQDERAFIDNAGTPHVMVEVLTPSGWAQGEPGSWIVRTEKGELLLFGVEAFNALFEEAPAQEKRGGEPQ